MVVPQNRWFIMENPTKMDDFFRKDPYEHLWYTYLDPPKIVPNGLDRVPLSNPVGFKQYPLEGAGYMFSLNLIFSH